MTSSTLIPLRIRILPPGQGNIHLHYVKNVEKNLGASVGHIQTTALMRDQNSDAKSSNKQV